ncbi:TPA: restriction endonuclease subunit S [Legionella pneumophila]|nr:restriction endonuclease subunit S [Legionella pneumophila]HBD9410565.1 restriction endonuclease subunit S [Legionella pneumophila]
MILPKFQLSQICDITMGQAPKGSSYNDVNEGYPLIAGAGDFGIKTPKPKKHTVKPTRLSANGDLILCIRATIGDLNWSDNQYCLGRGVAGLRPISNKLDKNYLWYFLQFYKEELQKKGTGSTFKQISRSHIEEIEVPLPPLEEQKRIAAILDKADAVRRKRQQAIELCEQLLRSVFLNMFGDPISNPKNWKKIKLGELCNIYRGGSPRPIQQYLGGTIPWIKIGDATKSDDIYLTSTKEKIIESGLSKTRLLQPGSLIFANCGVSLGFARILKIEGCIHDGWLAFDIKDSQLNQLFLLKALNQITKYFQGIAPDGTQPNLNTEIMKNFELIIPPIELQNTFEDIVSRVSGIKQSLVNALDLANNSFNSLMDKAFKGELSKQLEKELA